MQTDTDSVSDREESRERVLVPMCFGAESETSEEKAAISGTSVLWEAEDNIAVIDDKYSGVNRFFLSSGAGTSSATLSGTVTAGSSNYCAVFPADAAGSREGTDVFVTVPGKQVVSNDKLVDGNALVSVAYSTGSAFSFKNVCGFIQVTLTRSDVTSIEVEGTHLAGTARVNASTGELGSVTDGEDLVTLTYAGGGAFPTGTYYIAVLPGTSSDFTLRMLTASAFGRKTADNVSIVRKTYYTTSNSDITMGSGNLILSAAGLIAWNEGRTVTDADDVVALGADIDMDGQAWTAKDFAGVFEGRGKTIRNFSGSASFIQINSGTIRDLTLDGALTPATTTPIWFGAIAAKNAATGTITGCTNNASVTRMFDADATFNYGMAYAGIVGYNEGTLTGCTNEGEIKVEQAYDSGTPGNNQPLKSTILGGIAAYSRSDISGCVNTGTITRIVNGHKGSISDLTVSTEYPDPCLGGIVGLVYQATVSGCSNSAFIRCRENYLPCMSEGAWTSMGGIAGSVEGEVTGCINSGPFLLEAFNEDGTNGTPYTDRMYIPYLGGIVGSSVYAAINGNGIKDNLIVSNCTNTSDTRVNHCGTHSFGAVGGIVGWPCGEGVLVNTSVSSCTNTGSLYEYGCSRIRLGGILGGSGPARDCHFKGDITSYHKNGLAASGNSSQILIGGICGINQFKTGNDIVNCTVGNDADGTTIRYNLTDEDGVATIPANACFYGIGGLVGQAYTPSVANHTVFAGCSIKCAIYSNHPQDLGLLVGRFGEGGNNNSLYFGSSANKITLRNGCLVSVSRPLSSGAPYTTTVITASVDNVNTPLGESCSTWAWSGDASGSIVYDQSVKMGFLTGSTSASVSEADFTNITFSNN